MIALEKPPSIKRMRVICQKEKLRKPDDLTRRHRMLSIYATWLLVHTPVTADHVTIASIFTGLAAAYFIAQQGVIAGLAGCVLLYVSFLFDQVDGEVARYRRKSSLRGVYLDEIRHLLIYAAPVFALGYELARSLDALWPVAVSAVGAMALALARIEERLPALMFGERATKLARETSASARLVPVKASVLAVPVATESPLREAAKAVLAAVNGTYEILAHQVLILGWFVLVIGMDRSLEIGFSEPLFLVLLTGATVGALLGTMASRLRPGAIEDDVRARARAVAAAVVEGPEKKQESRAA